MFNASIEQLAGLLGRHLGVADLWILTVLEQFHLQRWALPE